MHCPRCHSALAELDRDGITIDRCDACRGIWLDRGELEKLLARNTAAEPRGRSRHGDDDDDDEDDGHRARRHGERRSSWWEIFD